MMRGRRRRLRKLDQMTEEADRRLNKAKAEVRKSQSDAEKVATVQKASEWLEAHNSISRLIKHEIIGGG